MTRIAKTPTTDLYRSMNSKSAAFGETNDCSVIAVATVTGCGYREAHDELCRLGRKQRRGVSAQTIIDATLAMGCGAVFVDPREFIDQYPGAHKNLKSVTTHHMDRFNEVWRDGNTYLVFTTHHVLAVIDGVNHDWTRGRALRAESIYRITPKGKRRQEPSIADTVNSRADLTGDEEATMLAIIGSDYWQESQSCWFDAIADYCPTLPKSRVRIAATRLEQRGMLYFHDTGENCHVTITNEARELFDAEIEALWETNVF